MTTMTIERDGKLTLPPDIQERSGLLPETSVRVIETRNGILLVPLSNEPMSDTLAQELAQWQELGRQSWEEFPYEEEV